jgi:hypothetical protein
LPLKKESLDLKRTSAFVVVGKREVVVVLAFLFEVVVEKTLVFVDEVASAVVQESAVVVEGQVAFAAEGAVVVAAPLQEIELSDPFLGVSSFVAVDLAILVVVLKASFLEVLPALEPWLEMKEASLPSML